jgi:hypothetical protein
MRRSAEVIIKSRQWRFFSLPAEFETHLFDAMRQLSLIFIQFDLTGSEFEVKTVSAPQKFDRMRRELYIAPKDCRYMPNRVLDRKGFVNIFVPYQDGSTIMMGRVSIKYDTCSWNMIGDYEKLVRKLKLGFSTGAVGTNILNGKSHYYRDIWISDSLRGMGSHLELAPMMGDGHVRYNVPN